MLDFGLIPISALITRQLKIHDDINLLIVFESFFEKLP
jgi:hypothetical protein